MSPTPTGSQGWGGLGEQWTTSCGLSWRHLGFQPPILCPQSHSILPCFSKTPDRGCPDFWGARLIMTASFCPSDFHGTTLSTEIKTEWPYSLQEEAVGQAAGLTDLCPCGAGGGRPGIHGHGNSPILCRCGGGWHSFRSYWLDIKYVYVYFLKRLIL